MSGCQTTNLVGLVVLVVTMAGCPIAPDGPVDEPCLNVFAIDDDACATLAATQLESALPPARGNAVGDDQAAAELGFEIFYDARFSANLDVRCANCHEPEAHFDDDEVTSVAGLGDVSRNSPTILNIGRQRVIFWDGRADSVWSQPLFAFEAENEMNFSRLEIAHRVAQSYRADYETIFGDLPSLDDGARFPPAGKPGDDAFDNMNTSDKDAVHRVVTNVGKALEAYMRLVTAGRAPFDDLLEGTVDANDVLDASAQRGVEKFFSFGCIDCHHGPMFTDERFYNVGMAPRDGVIDDGRKDGARTLATSIFSLRGAYADAPVNGDDPFDSIAPDDLLDEASTPEALSAFRTPTLRNLRTSAPYGHDGRFATLDDVIRHHLDGGDASGVTGAVSDRIKKATYTDDDVVDLVSFLTSLDGAYPGTPWNNWPNR